MEGFVQGDGIPNLENNINFAGQVLDFRQTDIFHVLPAATGDEILLHAVYEVQAGSHSFRTLIRGGQDLTGNKAYLDGRVLGGWLAGSPVHVQFAAISCSRPNAANGQCFQGTITISPVAD
jgi:hypothetical protein